jgi:L-cysteine S-thiosulfotransferase
MRRKSALGTALGVLGAAAAIVLLSACSDPKSAAGFRLPDGKPDFGRAAFARMNCTACHTVAGEKFEGMPTLGVIVVPLGGEVARVQTYGQLVTSIINPQHIVDPKYQGKYTDAAGASLMPDYTKTMTVEEMIHLVAFLQVHYQLKLPDYPYGPPL